MFSPIQKSTGRHSCPPGSTKSSSGVIEICGGFFGCHKVFQLGTTGEDQRFNMLCHMGDSLAQ